MSAKEPYFGPHFHLARTNSIIRCIPGCPVTPKCMERSVMVNKLSGSNSAADNLWMFEHDSHDSSAVALSVRTDQGMHSNNTWRATGCLLLWNQEDCKKQQGLLRYLEGALQPIHLFSLRNPYKVQDITAGLGQNLEIHHSRKSTGPVTLHTAVSHVTRSKVGSSAQNLDTLAISSSPCSKRDRKNEMSLHAILNTVICCVFRSQRWLSVFGTWMGNQQIIPETFKWSLERILTKTLHDHCQSS